MNDKFKERSFLALAALLLLGASAIAVVDKEQRSSFMDLATNVVIGYEGWAAGSRNTNKKLTNKTKSDRGRR